jgi:tetratricopeptide (TPR) repeat protein
MRPLRLLCSFASLVIVVGPVSLLAQSVPAAMAVSAATPDKYAGESVVIEHLDQVFAMNADGTGYHQQTVAVKVQSDAAVRQLGVITVPFAGASQRVEFKYARVRRADGTVVETPVADALEQPQQVTLQAPFYSDLKQEQLPVKSLRVGDTLEWQARILQTKSEAPGQFWGGYNFVTADGVVLAESLELRVPAAMTVNVWTDPAAGVKPVERTEGDQRIYRWEHANLKPTVGKEADDEKKEAKTRVLSAAEVLDADQGKLPSVAWSTFQSWAAVGAWYRGLEGDRAMPDAEIKAKVAELTAGKTTEEDKVRAVYAFVSTQVRYIGVDFGVGRYQPHRADEVLDNQYGDCKDKHTLLAAMLTALGLHPDAVLIGAGVRFNEAVPSPAAFNHVITRVEVDGQDVWLDSTAEVAPYKMLVATIRDKRALVVPDTGAATLQRTPADLPFASFQDWVAVGTLDKAGVSESKITLTERGDAELFLREVLRQVAPAQYDEFVQKLLGGLGYGGTSSHAEISRPDDPGSPLVIKFDYHREQAGDWANYRIIPQLAPVSVPVVNEKEPPVAPLDLSTPRTETSTAEMKLPEGWGVELPEAVHEKTAFATYDQSYRFEKGTLYSERRLVILQRKVPAEQWKVYKKWQDAIGLENEAFVQLIHTGGGEAPHKAGDKADSAGAPAGTAYDPKAGKLIDQAMQALRKLDDGSASSLLDQARDLNPRQQSLWWALGNLALMRGERIEALSDYHKELALHPDSFGVYAAMAQAQRMGGDKPAAEATLRTWTEADSSNPVASTTLIATLLADGKADAALSAANAALVRLPADQRDDPRLQLVVGQAEMKAGVDGKGVATLTALLKTTDDPSTTNSIAYLLADGNKQLALAESSERTVLDKLSVETQSWTLDEAPQTLTQKTALLVASWDTMGWILFREGKLPEAESYVEAAWLNSLRADVGEHLVEIRAAIADPGHASEREKATAGADKAQNPNPGKSQQELRTVSLGPAEGRTGVAEYRLLISQGKVERAEPVEVKTLVRATELLEKAKLTRLFPLESNAKLMREAMVNCHSGQCDLVFVP